MTRPVEKAAATAAACALIAALVLNVVERRTGLAAAAALQPFALLSLLVAWVAWLRARLGRLTDEERRDGELARRATADSALFSNAEAEPFSVGRTAAQLERWAVPAVPLVLALAFGFWSIRGWQSAEFLLVTPRESLLGAASLGGLAFALFLLSRYLIGLARHENERLARAPGIVLGLASLGAAAAALGAVAAHLDWPAADHALARGLYLVLAVLAVEQVALFLGGLYTPRSRQRGPRMPYESRLGALLTDPAAWARTLAESFDYQFGTGVAESISMRFLRRALLPLLLVQGTLLYLMSCLVFLGPEEAGILEHFGRPHPTRAELGSGFHLKAPWPFETVRRVPAQRILVARIGFTPAPEEIHPTTLLWTVPHYREEDTFLTAGASSGQEGEAISVGLVSFNVPVEYRVTNLMQFVYGHADPDEWVRDLSYRALTRELAARDFVQVVGPDRLQVSRQVQQRIQQEADRHGLGVEILFVGVQSVHPPVTVAPAFQSVVGALEQREASILEARAYTNSALPVARAEADRVRLEAEAARLRRVEIARADTDLFQRRLDAYRVAPAVFTSDLYLGAVTRALRGSRKFILDHPQAHEVLTFNFEEKAYPDLFDLGPLPEEDSRP
jgi:regulator of protease activity HflC (stomatin/prohibitin superfamily)